MYRGSLWWGIGRGQIRRGVLSTPASRALRGLCLGGCKHSAPHILSGLKDVCKQRLRLVNSRLRPEARYEALQDLI